MKHKVIYTNVQAASCTSRLCSEPLWVFWELGMRCPFERRNKDEIMAPEKEGR